MDRPRDSAITFGVELEFVLLFHTTELKKILTEYEIPHTSIIKQLEDLSDHIQLLGEDDLSNQGRRLYPSWAIEAELDEKNEHQTLTKCKFSPFTVGPKQRQIRRYLAEPLLIAQDILRRSSLHADVMALIQTLPEASLPYRKSSSDTLRSRKANYEQNWTLTNDHTLLGPLKSQVMEVLPGLVTDYAKDEWDSFGIEMISPVFYCSAKEQAFQTISAYLGALAQGSTFATLQSVWASTQVHIGFDIKHKDGIPVGTLQHLAFILALHEQLISKCFPRSRCGIEVRAEQEHTAEEDFEEFDKDAEYPVFPEKAEEVKDEEEELVRSLESTYTGYQTVKSNLSHLSSQIVGSTTPSNIAQTIFQQNGSLAGLIQTVQGPKNASLPNGERHRGYMVNWNNLWALEQDLNDTWKAPKPTIEFRQHECTTDPKAIQSWVEFLLAIVRKAEEMAHKVTDAQNPSFADNEARKYPEVLPFGNVTDFCKFLELDETGILYWQGRYAKYENDRPSCAS